MRELEQKRKYKRYLYTPVTMVILLIIIFFLARGVLSAREKERLSEERLARAKVEASELQAKYASTTREVNFLKTEEGVDAELRLKYRLVREGEGVAVIVDDNPASAAQSLRKISPWQKFWGWFGIGVGAEADSSEEK